MQKHNLSEKNEEKPLRREVVSLAGPTMLEQLLQSTVNYVDTAMVGSMGTVATAAVGSTMTVNWLINGLLAALGVGFMAYISQAFGARADERARRASMQSVIAALAVGVFITAVVVSVSRYIPGWVRVDEAIRPAAAEYFFILSLCILPRTCTAIFGSNLRAAGDSKTPLKVAIMVNIINVLGNLFLIFPTRTVSIFGGELTLFGAGLGVAGAAIASSASVFFGGVLITIAYLRHDRISPLGNPFKIDRDILRPCLRVAFPNVIQRFGTSFGYVVFASMINSLGEISTTAHTIANTVESAFYIPGFGMQAAAATISGNVIGARDILKQKKLANEIRTIEFVLMMISGTLLFFSARLLVGLFTTDPQVIELGTLVLRMVAVSEPIYGLCIATEGMLYGAGKTTWPLVFNISTMWGIRILGTFIFTQLMNFGLVAAWGSMIAHNVVLYILFAFYFRYGKWNPLRTESNQAEKGVRYAAAFKG